MSLPPGGGRAVWFLDDLLELKVTGAETGGALCVLEDRPAAGFRPLPHLHRNEDETVRILAGEFTLVTVDGERGWSRAWWCTFPVAPCTHS